MSFTLNIIFLYKPILGAPKSSITAYLKDWGWNRIIAYAAGIICGLGNTFQFMGGQVISICPCHPALQAKVALSALILTDTMVLMLLLQTYTVSDGWDQNLLM